jgi:outer membrane protein assembly factor BamB
MKRHSRWLIGLGCLAALGTLTTTSGAQQVGTGLDWLQGYQDATSSGFSATAISASPRLLWGFSAKSKDGFRVHPNSGSAIYNGVLFTSGDKNPLDRPGKGWSEFYAIDVETGESLWTFDPKRHGAVHDGLVAVDVARSLVLYPAHDGYLRALDISTGELLWEMQLCDAKREMCDLEGGVTLANGRAYYVSNDWAHAIVPDRKRPIEVWRISRGEIAHGVATKPVVSGGRVFFGGFGWFWAVDELSGAVLWRSPTSSPNFTYGFDIPHIWNNVVYASASRSGYVETIVTARDARTGATVWERVLPLGFAVKSSTGYGKLFLSYFTTPEQGGVVALDLATGKELWKFDHVGFSRVGPINGGPAVADNKVIVGSTDGNVYMLDQGTGRLLWSFDTGESMHAAVAVADGRFFIGAYKTFRAFGP